MQNRRDILSESEDREVYWHLPRHIVATFLEVKQAFQEVAFNGEIDRGFDEHSQQV